MQLSNRFVTEIRTDKSNGSIILELSMPTYAYKSSFEWSHLEDSIGGLESLLLGWRETEGGREEDNAQVMGSSTLLVNRLHRGSSLFGYFFYFFLQNTKQCGNRRRCAKFCMYKTKKFTLFKAKATKIYLNLLIVGRKGTGF
jgi:hypothetical protein